MPRIGITLQDNHFFVVNLSNGRQALNAAIKATSGAKESEGPDQSGKFVLNAADALALWATGYEWQEEAKDAAFDLLAQVVRDKGLLIVK